MKKKNILLVGASSASAISLVEKYGNIYNFICLSRDSKHSIVENFDLNDDSSYYNGTTKYDGLVYFPNNKSKSI